MPRFSASLLSRAFFTALGITLLIWILRGVRLLTFIPGAILWLGIGASLVLGLLAAWEKSKRW